MNPAANPQSAHFAVESWEGKDQTQLPMSMREVPTPGNRPAHFASLYDLRNKSAKAPDFYDPYFPLRFLEVPRSESPNGFQKKTAPLTPLLFSRSYL